MTDTPARLLRLLSLLQTPREWPGSELAERLGVTDRTVRRDIDRLRDLGYPVEATLGAAGGYRLVAGKAMPPLLLDDEEAVAIAIGLRAAASSALTGIEEASVRALTKLDQVLPAKLRRRVQVLGTAVALPTGDGPAADPEILTILAAAVTNRERVRFTYTTATASHRHLEPLGVVSSRRRWYLVGYDLDRTDWRVFRVDRITNPHPTAARFTPRPLPAANPAAYVTGHRTNWGTPQFHVAVTLQAPADKISGRLGDTPGDLTPLTNHSCRLEATRDDSPEWLAHRLITLGVDFEVHEPPELIDCLRAISSRIANAIPRQPS
ncbi:YafY family protein [Nocardia sp. NPDC051832]|uniref:helix-turn-helix transcriptional regulator n=1 Tax=Nocardia sp. NPDC051832 TaxID=3155673 RepID=UPI00343652C5